MFLIFKKLMSENYILSQSDLDEIKTIEDRWKDNKEVVCVYCLSQGARHWDRNCSEFCPNDEVRHMDQYDGDVYAESGKDIHTLLNIIKRMHVYGAITPMQLDFMESIQKYPEVENFENPK